MPMSGIIKRIYTTAGERGFFRPKILGPVAIVLFVLVANSLYVSGVFNQNPINTQSGLLVQSSKIEGGLDTIDPNDGFTTQALGHTAAEDILHGHMPWWDHNEEVGAPLAGGMQAAALFPLTLILALSNGVLLFHILLEVIAGLSTYYLLRKLKCTEAAAIIGGMLFAANGTFAWLGNAAFNPIAFLPMLLLGIEIAYDKSVSHQKRGWLLITVALALSCYAGFPETAYLDALFAGGWLLIRLLQLRNGPWFSFSIKLLTGLCLGLLLSAPILIAFLDVSHAAYLGIHSGEVIGLHLPTAGLPALVFPYLYGSIFASSGFDPSGTMTAWWGSVGGYITLSLIFMALVGLATKGNKYLKVFLVGWIVIMVARIYGFPGLYHVLDLIPGMSVTAVYRYVQPSIELALVILAALGLSHILQGKKLSKHSVTAIGVTLSIITLAALALAVKYQTLIKTAPHHWLLLIGSVVWSIGTVSAMILIIRSSLKYKKIILSSILVIDVLVMFIVPDISALHTARLDTQPVKYLQTHLGNGRFYSLGPIVPNYGSYYNIAEVNTNNLPLPSNWASYITQDLDPDTIPSIFDGTYTDGSLSTKQAFFNYMPAYRYIGVKYVVTNKGTITPTEAKNNQLVPVFADQATDIYEISNPQPYYKIVKGDCTVKAGNASEVNIDCRQPGVLMRRELYTQGWTATANGSRLTIGKIGPLFQSVNLPKGNYVVSFDFLPSHMFEAAGLMLVGIAIVVIVYFDYLLLFLKHVCVKAASISKRF